MNVLDHVWNQPLGAKKIIDEMLGKNQNVFDFEKALTW